MTTETGLQAELGNAGEVAIRRNRIAAAKRRGDVEAAAHERLALAFARDDQERAARFAVPVEPAQRPTVRPPRQRGRRRLKGGRPRRRVASRSAGGGSSGDDLAGSSEPPGLAGRHPGRAT